MAKVKRADSVLEFNLQSQNNGNFSARKKGRPSEGGLQGFRLRTKDAVSGVRRDSSARGVLLAADSSEVPSLHPPPLFRPAEDEFAEHHPEMCCPCEKLALWTFCSDGGSPQAPHAATDHVPGHSPNAMIHLAFPSTLRTPPLYRDEISTRTTNSKSTRQENGVAGQQEVENAVLQSAPAIEERAATKGREICDCEYQAVKCAAGRLDYCTRCGERERVRKRQKEKERKRNRERDGEEQEDKDLNHFTSRDGGTGYPRENPTDQRDRPARFPHAKIRSDPTGNRIRFPYVGSDVLRGKLVLAKCCTDPAHAASRETGNQGGAGINKSYCGHSRESGEAPIPHALPNPFSCLQAARNEATRVLNVRYWFRVLQGVSHDRKRNATHRNFREFNALQARLLSPLHTEASAVCSLAVAPHLAVMGFAKCFLTGAPEYKGEGEMGEPRENPRTSGIVRHDSQVRKSRGDPSENRTRFVLVWGEGGGGGSANRALFSVESLPDFSHLGIVPDDAASRRVFSEFFRFPSPVPASLHPPDRPNPPATLSTPHVRWVGLLVCKYGRRGATATRENYDCLPLPRKSPWPRDACQPVTQHQGCPFQDFRHRRSLTLTGMQMRMRPYLDGDADEDEQQVCAGEADQEHVGRALHTAVAADGEDDERVADDPEHERETVDDERGQQLRPVERLHRLVVVVLVVVLVVVGGGVVVGRRRGVPANRRGGVVVGDPGRREGQPEERRGLQEAKRGGFTEDAGPRDLRDIVKKKRASGTARKSPSLPRLTTDKARLPTRRTEDFRGVASSGNGGKKTNTRGTSRGVAVQTFLRHVAGETKTPGVLDQGCWDVTSPPHATTPSRSSRRTDVPRAPTMLLSSRRPPPPPSHINTDRQFLSLLRDLSGHYCPFSPAYLEDGQSHVRKNYYERHLCLRGLRLAPLGRVLISPAPGGNARQNYKWIAAVGRRVFDKAIGNLATRVLERIERQGVFLLKMFWSSPSPPSLVEFVSLCGLRRLVRGDSEETGGDSESNCSLRLARSPPNKAIWAQSPAGSPDFRKWESCRTIPLVDGSSRRSSVSPAPSLRRSPAFTSIALIGSPRPRSQCALRHSVRGDDISHSMTLADARGTGTPEASRFVGASSSGRLRAHNRQRFEHGTEKTSCGRLAAEIERKIIVRLSCFHMTKKKISHEASQERSRAKENIGKIP
ncbi:hypothetical protein PR048_030754 [Dryococelus australis]|uniref:Uncharacterized protein n=1 Tax=Dryococelus australis TaxID=614101 RepID=A0ABQ9G9T5_9NEOP|nr:hypothetical protein PR048_030754 [Dryococelus australis]